MDKVFPISNDPLLKSSLAISANRALASGAVVDKVLGSGKYIVAFKDGTRLTALGPDKLAVGAKVQVAPFADKTVEKSGESLKAVSSLKGDQWLAKFPLRFASGTSEVKLELRVEDGSSGPFDQKEPVIHLVFSLKTNACGQVQWSVYLRRNQVLAQVYVEKGGVENPEVVRIIREFEDSLKKKGFSLLAPTVILKRPMKVSAGLQLNLQG